MLFTILYTFDSIDFLKILKNYVFIKKNSNFEIFKHEVKMHIVFKKQKFPIKTSNDVDAYLFSALIRVNNREGRG